MPQRLSFSVVFPEPVSNVYSALLTTLAFRRWAGAMLESGPRVRQRYRHQGQQVLRQGRVVELIPPIGVTLVESLLDPPCEVRLKLRWRLEPIADGSLARQEISYELNYAAALRAHQWRRRLSQHFHRQFGFVSKHLAAIGQPA